uniref:Ig-like domain-containing protein n=1 Tax=Denticeps clupeoides TaxID=299321 RepID=A0AAY4BZC6_9TELE
IILSLIYCEMKTPGNLTARLGEAVTLRCEIQADVMLVQVEWTKCGGWRILIADSESQSQIESNYTGRVADVTGQGFTLLQTKMGDFGDYCCKFTLFPLGPHEGRIHLRVKPSEQSKYTTYQEFGHTYHSAAMEIMKEATQPHDLFHTFSSLVLFYRQEIVRERNE